MIERLHYITQEGPAGMSHAQMALRACEAGARWVQLRIKEKPEAYCLEQARETRKICHAFGAKLIINDRVELALEVDADGVHLGQEDMDVVQARQLLGSKIVGGTANTYADVKELIHKGVDYIGLGPFRFTTTKKKLSPILGLEGYDNILKQLAAENLAIPIVAIGGIEQADVSKLRAVGLHGVAVASLINHSKNPQGEIQQLNQSLYETINNSQQVL